MRKHSLYFGTVYALSIHGIITYTLIVESAVVAPDGSPTAETTHHKHIGRWRRRNQIHVHGASELVLVRIYACG